jgi:DNA-binding response OmpR family regulator
MTEKTHILVVDDEPDLREMVEEYLSMQGFSVLTAENGTAMRRIIAEHPVDLVLLDVTMPGEDGFTLARFLRERYQVGIVMLTAANSTVDRVVGLEIGADDYLTKPFDPRELRARIKSVLRRMAARPKAGSSPPSKTSSGIPFGRCVLDLDAQRLLDARGTEVPMTGMEFALLKAFATHPNRVLTRDQLLELAHYRGEDPFDRSIDIRIARLRRKIEADPARPQTIKTLRGAGYIFIPNDRS